MDFIRPVRKNLLKLKRKVIPLVNNLNKKRIKYYNSFLVIAKKRPLPTFGVLLFLLLVFIILSNLINKPKATLEETTLPTKEVSTYTIGESPRISVQAQVEKSGVIKIVALGGGVVQKINVEVGQSVGRGTNLVSLSTNYQGGNAFSVQRQLAYAQYKNVTDTYQTNKDLINKQKELAEKSNENTDELRQISNQSLDSTRTVVNLNNEILTSLEALQADQEANNNQTGALQTKQLRSQLLSANGQLENALRNTEYASNSDNPPTQIANISKEIALKQLDIQSKALDLNKEVSRLSLTLAQINESLMYPATPIDGVVERIFVREGQSVAPGTPIAQISGVSNNLIAVAFLSKELSQGIGRATPSTIHVGEKTFESVPFYVSDEATDGSLYTAHFAIPLEYASEVTDKSYITIEVPLDFPKTGSTVPFVPIDSVFQTEKEAFLFVMENGKAVSRKVSLGQVLGRFVEVEKGLKSSDQVILNRNVIQGDPVKVIN